MLPCSKGSNTFQPRWFASTVWLLLQADPFSLSGPEQGTLTQTKKGNSLLCQPEQELRLVKDIPQKASSVEAAFLKEDYTAKTLAISADKKRGGLHLATADVRADMTVEKIMRTKKFWEVQDQSIRYCDA